ncbi:MAG: phasin family protein [Bacteroidia bacterium]
MEDLIKKFLYTGVGIAALTAEKMQEAVDELVGKGKVSEEEGKKIVDEFADKAETRREKFERELSEMVENVKKGTIFPQFMTKEDFETILGRIEAIEKKIDAGTESDVKAVVKKTTAAAKKVAPKK